jgi:uncharacterized protein YceK
MKPQYLALCICLIVLSGCSTWATVVGRGGNFPCDEKYTIKRMYSGISNDIRFLHADYQDGGFAVLDMPFSLIADTILLPYTFYTQLRYGNLCDKKKVAP